MRVGQLVQISAEATTDYDAENGSVRFIAQTEEEVLQIIALINHADNRHLNARVYSPEQRVTFDVPCYDLVPNSFIDNEEALTYYEWPLLPIITVDVEVKCTDRQVILPVLPEPRLLPASELNMLPYYTDEGASTPPAESDTEYDEEGSSAITRIPRPYTMARGAVEAISVIAIAVAVYFFFLA